MMLHGEQKGKECYCKEKYGYTGNVTFSSQTLLGHAVFLQLLLDKVRK